MQQPHPSGYRASMLSVRGLLALVVIAAVGYVALRLTWPADCEECSAMPEALLLQGALGLWLLVLVATVGVGALLAWRWLTGSKRG